MWNLGGEPSSLPCIKNTAFREGTPPLVSPFRTISTIFSKGASYWLLESTRGRRFCIQFYNISAYMALTLDILSLVNNIKIIEFSKICWIGLEFFLVYIYLNYTIYIHTCDTFYTGKNIYLILYYISYLYICFCTWFLFKNIQYIMSITV